MRCIVNDKCRKRTPVLHLRSRQIGHEGKETYFGKGTLIFNARLSRFNYSTNCETFHILNLDIRITNPEPIRLNSEPCMSQIWGLEPEKGGECQTARITCNIDFLCGIPISTIIKILVFTASL